MKPPKPANMFANCPKPAAKPAPKPKASKKGK